VQRGNNRAPCFLAEGDRLAYLEWLREAALFHGVAVHAYVLMTNHVHLLVTPEATGGVSAMMQTLGRRYVRYVNRKHHRTGTLWEGRFKACLVDSERYVVAAYRYIDLNPVRAGIVGDAAAFRWSSYAAHANLRHEQWLRPHDGYLALGMNTEDRGRAYRDLCGEAMAPREIDAFRAATARELVYGSEAFKDRIAATAERQVRAIRPGTAGG
jgi:putative transposase